MSPVKDDLTEKMLENHFRNYSNLACQKWKEPLNCAKNGNMKYHCAKSVETPYHSYQRGHKSGSIKNIYSMRSIPAIGDEYKKQTPFSQTKVNRTPGWNSRCHMLDKEL